MSSRQEPSGAPKLPLFDSAAGQPPDERLPLAARMRPRSFAEFVGQDHLVAEGRVLRQSVEADRLSSLILWGPPGTGKTTLASIIAGASRSHFAPVSAVTSGVADLRRITSEARERYERQRQKTILFIDEIHRFNKAQQDAVLPFVEDGTVILIGATTENPSFEVIAPLLSRCRVFTLEPLTDDQVALIVRRAIADQVRGLGRMDVDLPGDALEFLVRMSNGDARVALNVLELAAASAALDVTGRRALSVSLLEDALQHRALLYDRAGEEHYNLISALHKSLRGSDPDAGLYWLGRMLEAGEDPLYIARRLVRFASEDVGLADPQALLQAVAAQQAAHFVGMPEGNLALAQAVVYLATAPKSNSLYTAYSKVQEDVRETRADPVPLHLRNPVTSLMRQKGYGRDYKYAHNYPDHFVEEQYLPPGLAGKTYYEPSDHGYETTIAERLKRWWTKRRGPKSP